ncbi:MAG: haloacid dehalogenase-like hydrolase [bacterium]
MIHHIMFTNRYAFFDCDNTIYNGYTGNELFDYFASKTGDYSNINNRLALVKKYQNGTGTYHAVANYVLNQFSKLVKGMTVSDVLEIFGQINQAKETIFFPWVRPVIKFLKQKQFKILLVSAGVDVVNAKFVKELELDGHISTIIPQKNGRFTGGLEL